jgi:hypothetical protein
VGWLRSGTTWRLRLGREEVLGAVSCPGRVHCFAIGTYLGGTDAFQPIFEESPGLSGPWKPRRAPPLPGQFGLTRYPIVIACPSAMQCEAVSGGGTSGAMWTGGQWFRDSSAVPFDTALGIACPDTSMCVTEPGRRSRSSAPAPRRHASCNLLAAGNAVDVDLDGWRAQYERALAALGRCRIRRLSGSSTVFVDAAAER